MRFALCARDITTGSQVGFCGTSSHATLGNSEDVELYARYTSGSNALVGIEVSISITRVDNGVVDANAASIFNTADGNRDALIGLGLAA